MCAAYKYCVQMLESFFGAVEIQFRLGDVAKQYIEKWCILKQVHSVTVYMNEVDTLEGEKRVSRYSKGSGSKLRRL